MIKNKLNQESYIGQSICIERRWKQHIATAEKTEKNLKLYNAMRKYGIQNFDFEIIEECEKEKLSEREVYWINYYNSFLNGYNNTSGGESNYIYSDELRERLSAFHKGRSEEQSELIKNLWKTEEYRNKVTSSREAVQQNAKAVVIYKNNKVEESFPSIWRCTHYMVNHGYGNDFEGVRRNIRNHIKRESKTFMSENIQIRYKDLQRL